LRATRFAKQDDNHLSNHLKFCAEKWWEILLKKNVMMNFNFILISNQKCW
jgi:hypothetical protein